MITPEFSTAYKRLNPEQKKAVDSIDGPVMVVAGPGTGKTEVLTLRIANILLQTDTKPENILALTFTEAASTNMRKRLFGIIGSPAYRVRIQTFHSFCNDILQSYPEYFPRVIGSSSITDVEASLIIEGIINDLEGSILRPWGEPLLYVSDILRKIEELKREGLTPEKFSKLVERTENQYKERSDLYHEKGAYKGKMKSEHTEYFRKIEKNKELAFIYGKYQEKLLEKRLYDFSDMIMEVLKALEGALEDPKLSDLKLILQENHQYVLVDEHQDTNNAQNKILELLLDFHQNPNVFVVGDSKQAIFRFQGASVENFLHFKELYPKAVLIDLFRNYRSTQGILDGAHSLIPSETPLKSFAPLAASRRGVGGEVISIASFENSSLENFWIAERIKSLEGETAIIYRSNREAFAIADTLSKFGISHSIESDEDLFGDLFVRKFISLLYAVHHYGDENFLAPALHVEELGLDTLDAYKLMRDAKNKRASLYDVLPKEIEEKLKMWTIKSKEESLLEFLEILLQESGLIESMLKSKDAEAFLGIERLFEEVKKISSKNSRVTLAEFVEYLNALETHGIFIKRPKADSKSGAVRLMTAHRSKGLEFENVFIINASEKSFGGKLNREKLPLINLEENHFQKVLGSPQLREARLSSNDFLLDDERRLFYVALTRAKRNIFITYHKRDPEGKEMLPSVFLSEIKDELKEEIDTKEFEEKINKDKSLLFKREANSKKREIDQEFVQQLFLSRTFSVTALNNYLSCPWKYFYRNLLRIPEVQPKYLLYGTAMHAAVEDFFNQKLKKEARLNDEVGQVTKEILLESFEKHLLEAGLSSGEEKEALKRGRESLSVWYDSRHDSWLLPYKMEQSLWSVDFDGIRLSGKLDKVEFVDQAEVFVTDYKTGKAKSRNDIEGKTKDGSGDMKRQLNFYKLLLDLWEDGKYNMTKGTIEFLEPNESGKIKWEEFIIEKDEVEELKTTIKRVAEEIMTLSFWDKYCDEKECKYCAYRRLLDK